jgi:GT2 family glycosyltransferase
MLDRLLRELSERINSEILEIWVVNNASIDQTVEVLERYPAVKVITNTTNRMSAEARQQGLDMCSGEYVCFVDDDNVVPEGMFLRLASYLDAHPGVGLIGPIQRRLADDSIWCAGGKLSRFLFVKYNRNIHSTAAEFDFHPNVFMFRSSLVELGVGFDWRNFPHNWSEPEFGVSIKRAGYSVMTDPTATVYHDINYQGSFTRISEMNLYDQAKSRITYRAMYANDLPNWIFFLCATLPGSFFALGLRLLTRHERNKLLKAYLNGTYDGFRQALRRPTRTDNTTTEQ